MIGIGMRIKRKVHSVYMWLRVYLFPTQKENRFLVCDPSFSHCQREVVNHELESAIISEKNQNIITS